MTLIRYYQCLSSIINDISELTTPWKYINIPQQNMSQLQRNNSNDTINITRGILARLSVCFMCYCCIKLIKSRPSLTDCL